MTLLSDAHRPHSIRNRGDFNVTVCWRLTLSAGGGFDASDNKGMENVMLPRRGSARHQRAIVYVTVSLLALVAAPAGAQTTPAPASDPKAVNSAVTPEVEEQATSEATSRSTAAEEPRGDVIVTARRVEENIQKVPLQVTALSAETLKQQSILRPRDLTYTVPSLTVAPAYNTLNNNYAIRGLAAGVATYFSESPCCTPGASVPFLDISSVQVLNGPQGTLFGRTSGSGAVLITPAHPNLQEGSLFFSQTIGTYGRAEFVGVMNAPLIEDKLGIRVAAGINHLNGYTRIIGTNQRLDQVNNQHFRVGVELRAGAFRNYLVGTYFNLDQTHSNAVLGAIYPDLPTLSSGPSAFTAVCTSAVNLGFATSVASCASQRAASLAQQKAALIAEYARVSRGGDAIRFQPAAIAGVEYVLKERRWSFVNVAELSLGKLGPVDLTLRDIASVDSCTNITDTATDGIGGILENGLFNTCGGGASNSVFTQHLIKVGPEGVTINNDAQVRFDAGEGVLSGNTGFFYTHFRQPRSDAGTGNIYQIFGGVFNTALQQNSAQGFFLKGHVSERAAYGQATLDVGKIGIPGLKLTGGYRYTWSDTARPFRNAVFNNTTGQYQPGTIITPGATKSEGYNYTASVQEEWTNKFMTYFTISRAYIPGFINTNVQNGTNLPNYKPVVEPQIVLAKEVGAKWDFGIGAARGRLNLTLYQYDFTNIAVGFSGFTGTTSIAYSANIAGAKMKGIEVGGFIAPTSLFEIRGSYNYNDAYYTKWTATDPINFARPGDSICLPSSPTGFCLLDLTNNPFPNNPRHQGHVTLVVHPPLDPSQGRIDVSGTLYAQSRTYYTASAARQLAILPTALNGISQSSYATLNLRATWSDIQGTGWNMSVFADNALDKVYKLSNTPQLLTLGFATATYAPPRMIGLEISRKFGL